MYNKKRPHLRGGLLAMNKNNEKANYERQAQIRQYMLERRNEAKVIRKIVTTIALIFTFLIGGTALGGFIYIKSALKPVDSKSLEETEIEVPIGSSSSTIGKLLEEKKIIKNATVFKYYVKLNNISGFQAGTYKLTPSMTLEEISKTLQTGILVRESLFNMTIPEGLQLGQIAAIIAKHTDHSQQEVMKTLGDREFIQKKMTEYPQLLPESILDESVKQPLEGYLYPATYPFYEENPPLESIIDTMLEQTNDVLAKYEDLLAESNLKNVHELLTMAALIEKEATEKADRKLIASVFYNRMKENMPLQTDPTVLYALGEHKERTLYKDLEIDSPYNTYKVKGLPPGPIANAGESSIEAALKPTESDYLYFLAEFATGDVYYSKTLKEHNRLKAKYITDKRAE